MTFDFTMAAYQPSEQQRTLVQAQHRSWPKTSELNTNDSSFTLDGVLSTLQQGSAENGVGSSVELRYHVKKRRAQICLQIQRLINFLQNYAGGRVRQPRTPNTSAARVVANLIKQNKKQRKQSQRTCVPSVDLSDVKLGDTAASVH